MKLADAMFMILVLILVSTLIISIICTTLGFMAKETLGLVFFIVISSVWITAIVQERVKKRRIVRFLASRPQLDDDQFAQTFFAQDTGRSAIAVRIRRVLAKNLSRELGGVNPVDRLNEDLDVELESNPDLFWELETEFRIKTDVEEMEAHEKTLARLITFGDLVDYIAALLREQPPPASPEPPPPATVSSRLYDGAIRCIPILCVTGFVVIVAGILIQKSIVMKLGTGLFLAGFAVWGLANGGGFASGLFLAVREKGLKELAAHPWTTLILTLLAAFFLVVGGFFVWAVAKALMSSN